MSTSTDTELCRHLLLRPAGGPAEIAGVSGDSATHTSTSGRKRLRGVVSAAVALTALAALAVGGAGPAAASSKGCTVYGSRTIGNVTVPSGTYCATIVGSGTTVNGVQGEFYAPNLCNWDVTAEFFDNHWNWKQTRVSGHNYGCSYGSAWAPYIGVGATISQLTGTPSGYVCSTLRVGWQRVTSVCNYVY